MRFILLLLIVTIILVVANAALKPLTTAQKAEITKRNNALIAAQHGKPLSRAQKWKIESDVRNKKKPTSKPTKKPVGKAKPVRKPTKKPTKWVDHVDASNTHSVTGPGASDTLDRTAASGKETMKTKGEVSMDSGKDPYAHDDGYTNQPYKDGGYPDGESTYQYDDVMSGSIKKATPTRATTKKLRH